MLITDVGSGVRKMNHMVFLNEKDVCSLLTPADAIAAAEETFLHIGLGDITVGDMALMYVDEAKMNNFHSCRLSSITETWQGLNGSALTQTRCQVIRSAMEPWSS